jgi:uncharacterized protein YjbI with pentapeptide repeats
MADPEHLKIIQQGVEVWNEWRGKNRDVRPDLVGADLREASLSGADLSVADLSVADLSGAFLYKANLSGADLREASLSETYLTSAVLKQADLREAYLHKADLRGADLNQADLRGATLIETLISGAVLNGANLSGADLREAELSGADLSAAVLTRAVLTRAVLTGAVLYGADLSGADLNGANLSGANLSRADLREADLTQAVLVGTRLAEGANLSRCKIFGVSAWRLELDDTTEQADLIITGEDEPVVTVDNLEVAQFIYLLLHNEKIRDVIDAITSKVVLILGRFGDERKAVLDEIREALRHRDLTPVLVDFDKPASKDVTGAVETLARMARFVIADLTDPSSVPHELATIIPFMRTTPIIPIRLKGAGGYSMFDDLERSYPWVLPKYEYAEPAALIAALEKDVIGPAQAKAEELRSEPGMSPG